MPRMLDDMFSGAIASPRNWLYNYNRTGKGVVVHDREESVPLLWQYRNRVRQGPIVVADAAVAYFVEAAGGKELQFEHDFPNMMPPHQHFFVETARPKLDAGVHLPRAWGWYFEVGSQEQVVPLLASRGVEPSKDLTYGVVGQLALNDAHGKQAYTAFPLATVIVQVGSFGDVVGPLVAGVPYQFDVSLVADYAGFLDYVQYLLQPIMFAVCCMNVGQPTVRRTHVKARVPKSQSKLPPSRRNKATEHPHQVLEVGPLLDVLRFEGQAGIDGLPAAIQRCKEHFHHPAKLALASRKILDASGQPFWVPQDKAKKVQ